MSDEPETLTRCPACSFALGNFSQASPDADARFYDPSSCACCFGAGRVTRSRAALWHQEHNERKTNPPR